MAIDSHSCSYAVLEEESSDSSDDDDIDYSDIRGGALSSSSDEEDLDNDDDEVCKYQTLVKVDKASEKFVGRWLIAANASYLQNLKTVLSSGKIC